MRRAAWWVGAFMLLGCSPQLEKPGIPVTVSLRLDYPFVPSAFVADLDTMAAYGIRHINLELPLIADSVSGTPRLHPVALAHTDDAIALIETHAAVSSYGLFITQTPDRPLFPPGSDTVPGSKWFAAYSASLHELARRLAPYSPPKVLFLGANYQPREDETTAWLGLFDSVIRLWPDAKLGYITSADRPHATWPLWDYLDYRGVYYHEPLGNETPKAAHRTWHRGFQTRMMPPVYITHTNLIGEPKRLGFQNKLRFWPDGPPEVSIAAVNLNSIYPQTVLTDTTTYFGWGQDRDAQAYLRAYLQAYLAPPSAP